MYRAVEDPLAVHLPFPPEGKSIESQGGAAVGKYRLCGGESLIINEATFHRIYFALHLLGAWGHGLILMA